MTCALASHVATNITIQSIKQTGKCVRVSPEHTPSFENGTGFFFNKPAGAQNGTGFNSSTEQTEYRIREFSVEANEGYLDLVKLKPRSLWLLLMRLLQLRVAVRLAAAARGRLRHTVGRRDAEPYGSDRFNGRLPRGIPVIFAAAPAAACCRAPAAAAAAAAHSLLLRALGRVTLPALPWSARGL